jgi:hypothetical protein
MRLSQASTTISSLRHAFQCRTSKLVQSSESNHFADYRRHTSISQYQTNTQPQISAASHRFQFVKIQSCIDNSKSNLPFGNESVWKSFPKPTESISCGLQTRLGQREVRQRERRESLLRRLPALRLLSYFRKPNR